MFSIVFDPFCPPARIIAFDAMPLISVGPWVLCQFWGAADKQMSSRFLENWWKLFIWAYIKRSESRLWMGTVSFQISIQTFHKTYADEWYSILDTELIKLILNWHWIDHKCFVHFCTINYLFNEKRSFYHAFLKFRFNEPWPGPRIRTSRQSELGLALWVLLNVCVGPTLRWKAHLEGNGCAKQRSVYSV